MTRTVRDVMVEWLGDGSAIDDVLRELREVLSTGDQWVTRDLEADALQAGDVIVARDGLLWSVAQPGYDAVGSAHEITRAGRTRVLTCPSSKPIAVLVRRDDARALALLERELGATTVERVVA